MTTIANALKAEIARISRKEIRAETETLKRASTRYRAEIAELKRQLAAMRKDLTRATRGGTRSDQSSGEAPVSRHRFSAKGLASQRQRLGLSAEAVGKLIGVSGLSIYHWEKGKSRPRERHLPALAALRKLGRREAAAVLATR